MDESKKGGEQANIAILRELKRMPTCIDQDT